MTVPVRCTFKSEHECPSEEMGDYTKQAQSVHVRNLVGCGNDAQKSKSATPMDGSSSFTIWTSTWTPWSMSTPSWRCSWWRMTVDALRPFSRPSRGKTKTMPLLAFTQSFTTVVCMIISIINSSKRNTYLDNDRDCPN